MLLKRIFTAVVGIAIAIFVINYGHWVFSVAVSLLALIAWHEYCRMLNNCKVNCLYWSGLAGILLLQLSTLLGNTNETVSIVFLFVLAILAKLVINFPRFTVADAAFSLLGVVYIGLSFSYIIAMRFIDAAPLSGMHFLWMTFIGTWASDTFAFFAGSKFGKVKLCPSLSPGKTREGAIGGLIGCIFCAAVFGYIVNFDIFHSLIIGVLIGFAAPVGDLAESAIKRFAGVKDSGNILPGHGGVLDRFDSIMFSVPVVYCYIYNVVWLSR